MCIVLYFICTSAGELLQLKKATKMFVYFAVGFFAARPNVLNLCGLSARGYWKLIALSGGAFVALLLIRSHFRNCAALPIIGYPLTSLSGSLVVFGISGLIARSNFTRMRAMFTFIDRRAFRIYLFHDPLNYLFLLICSNIGFLQFMGDGKNLGAALFVSLRFFGCLGVSVLLDALLRFISRAISPAKAPAPDLKPS